MSDTFQSLGRAGAIKKLYENSGYNPCENASAEVVPGRTVCSNALMLEGIDFDVNCFPLKHLGWKTVLKATGELFSEMAIPSGLNIRIGVSAKLDFKEVSEIWEGMYSAAKHWGYLSVALDIVPSLTGLCLSASACGIVPAEVLSKRKKPASMDLLCISGCLGAGFLGSRILQESAALKEDARKERLEKYRGLVGGYVKPELQKDISDSFRLSGVIPSLGRFCTRPVSAVVKEISATTGLGVKLYVDKLPFIGGSIDAAAEMKVDAVQSAVKGGDDCCVLFCIPIGMHDALRHDFQDWNVIGHLSKPETGVVLVSNDGLEHEL